MITESVLLPSLASITYIGIHICSGTILTDRFILTVAHCAYDGLHEILPKENMKIVLGKTSTENGTIYDIQGLIIHENFDNLTYANDIGLIRTLNSIIFGKNVAPMVLRRKAVIDKSFNDNATVSWFGFPTSEMNSSDETFLIANVRSIPIDVCRNTFVAVSLRHICMSSVATDGNCNEDSGGPLVIGSYGKIEQIGILSFSINCGINKPEVYTRISWYFEWIKKVMERVK
nr:chymotrypsin-1-like [Onthophagus taurus]